MEEKGTREKIADIIYHTGCTGACCECDYSKVSDADTYCKALLKADALIAAGLTFDKTKAILAERANSKMLIQKAQYYDQMKHRAEKEEKLKNQYCRALLNLARRYIVKTNMTLPHGNEQNSRDVDIEMLALYIMANEREQAEKELQEERSDDKRRN